MWWSGYWRQWRIRVNNFWFRVRRFLSRQRFAFSGTAISNPELLHPSVEIVDSQISGNVRVKQNSVIRQSSIQVRNASIGRNTSLWGPGVSIHAMLHPVEIGSFCSIAKNVSIQEYNHRVDRLSSHFVGCNLFAEPMDGDITSKGPIVIGNDVWLASNVVVASGVKIGDGAVVGANSVVLHDIPPYAIAAGAPARVIRYRFQPDVIVALLKMQWWHWSDEKIRANRELFLQPLTLERMEGAIDV